MTPIAKIELAVKVVKYGYTMYKWLKAEHVFNKAQGIIKKF